MHPVVVTISHSLDKEEVHRRLRPALGQAAHSLSAFKVEHEQWTGDRMDFRVRTLGQSVTGYVIVGEREVVVELALPGLLAKLADAVQKTIARKGQLLLEGSARWPG